MSKNVIVGTGVLVALAVVVGGVWLLIDPLATNRVWGFINHGFGTTLIILLVAAVVTLLVAGFISSSVNSTVGMVSGGAVALLFVVGLIAFGFARNWMVPNVYAEIAEVQDEEALSFEERVPWSVADNSANSAMSGINADRMSTKFLTGADVYTTPARERGTAGFIGYEAIVQQGFNLRGGVAEDTQCYFSDEASRSLGGTWWHSLERAIAAEDRTLLMNSYDAWGYCDDDTAYMVLPVDKYEGNIFNRHIVPAGIAVYNGDTGDVEIVDDATQEDYPGPLVSQTYAEEIESSMARVGNSGGVSGMIEVWREQSTGFQTAGGEGNDPNANNPGNHQLRYSDGGSAHVTPLTRVSTSTAIEYVLTVDAGEVAAGEHPKVNMNLLDPARQSNAVVHDEIRSTFADINWESGIRVLELTPGPDGAWVAFIGQSTTVVYQVTMQEDGSWELLDLRNNESVTISDDEIGDEIAIDDVIGDEGAENEGADTIDVDLSNGVPELGELSKEELSEIGQAVLEELAGRE